jgi:hypothetical protein
MNGCLFEISSKCARVQPRECRAPHAAPCSEGCSLNQKVFVETSDNKS